VQVVTPFDVVQITTVKVTEAEMMYEEETLTNVLKSAWELLVFAAKALVS
jgi:hypothetical protein